MAVVTLPPGGGLPASPQWGDRPYASAALLTALLTVFAGCHAGLLFENAGKISMA